MNRFLQLLVTLAWGLWLGGLVMLFIALQSIFHTFDQRRDLAGDAATGLFHAFTYYRLGLAAMALLATFGWWLAGRSRAKVVAFSFLALAVVVATYASAVLNPKLDRMRVEGQTHTAEFRRLHGASMGVYLLETVFVLGAGMTLPWGDGSASRPARATRVAPTDIR